MLFGVFRTKEGKMIAMVVIMSTLLIVSFFYKNLAERSQYHEQTVMAEQYLKAGDYEQAIEAYEKALSISSTEEESLTVGLSKAYIGINNYDKALEILRKCYQKTLGSEIKDKIVEVSSQKTDYEYRQIIFRADIYFSNKEFDKAISEYEKAKQIKSNEAKAYQKIAKAYLEKEEYEEAKEEVQQGLDLTKSKELEKTLAIVDSYLVKNEYYDLLEEAKEYINQDDYLDGIQKYKQAMKLMPVKEQAYSELAESYLAREDYNSAISVLKEASMKVKSESLEEQLSKAVDLQETKIKMDQIFAKLFKAASKIDTEKVKKIMGSGFFKEKILFDEPIYYSESKDNDKTNGTMMIMEDSKKLYAGEIVNSIKNGEGVYFTLTGKKDEQGCYYYEGQWKNGLPNGAGTTVEEDVKRDESGVKHINKTVTKGNYYNGTEHEVMEKYFYTDGVETGHVTYQARNGFPVPIKNENKETIFKENEESYAIGKLYVNGLDTGQYYYVKSNTCWGVEPLIK